MPDVDNTEEFRCISLCTGYAGLELGLRRVVPALRTVCYVEVEAFACANLVAKIEKGDLDAGPIWTDIKTFDGRPFYKRVHIITAGYPCQGESVAGKRQGKADPRWLWPHIERIIKTVEPLWFFGENVSGHLTLGYPTVYRSLRNLGYKVEARLVTACECGPDDAGNFDPHRRERLFILAYNAQGRCSRSYIPIRRPQQQKQPTINSLRTSKLENSCRTASGNQNGQADGRTRQKDVPQGNGQTCSVRLGAASELADTTEQRIQGAITERTAQAGRQTDQQGNQWPSRPGQPQYEWEEPRVVANTKSRQQRGGAGNRTCGGQREQKEATTDNGRRYNPQAQSRLGRATNGPSRRVDRLRLLGNGVVPQQAEKAFRELIKLF